MPTEKQLKQLMKLSSAFAPNYVDKVNVEKMEEWLMSLASEDVGYKHYYTMRKRLIQEGMVSGMSQEEYWMNHGRILELQYANALSVKLLKQKRYASKKSKGSSKDI